MLRKLHTTFFTHFSRSIFWQLLVILLITLFAYSNIFHNEFVGDDFDFIVNWELLRDWKSVPTLLSGAVPHGHEGVFRPLRGLMYLFMYQTFGPNPFPYHIFSLAVHLASTAFVFFITKKLTQKWWLPLLTGLFFGLHPIHTESITWITASFDALGFLFFFAAFYAYLSHGYTKSLVLAALAFFTEELTLTLPLLITWHSLCFPQKTRRVRGYWLVLGVYLVARLLRVGDTARGAFLAGSFWLTMLTSIKAVFMYVKLLLVPVGLSLDHTIPPGIFTFTPSFLNTTAAKAQSVSEPWFIGSLLAIILLGFLAWYFRRKNSLLAFGIGWFLLSLLPVSNLVPIYSPFREMYAYIASFGFILAITVLLSKLFTVRLVGVFLALMLCLFLGKVTFERNTDWKNEVRIWEATRTSSPSNPMIYYKLGSAYQQEKRYTEALLAYQKALELNPDLTFAAFNMGTIYQTLENCPDGIAAYTQAMSAYPELPLYTEALTTWVAICAENGYL